MTSDLPSHSGFCLLQLLLLPHITAWTDVCETNLGLFSTIEFRLAACTKPISLKPIFIHHFNFLCLLLGPVTTSGLTGHDAGQSHIITVHHYSWLKLQWYQERSKMYFSKEMRFPNVQCMLSKKLLTQMSSE